MLKNIFSLLGEFLSSGTQGPSAPEKMSGASGHSRTGVVLALMCCLPAIALGVLAPALFQSAENVLLDTRMRMPHQVQAYPNIVFVDIDDRSIDALGRWPWPRSRTAEIVSILDGAGIWGLFLDVLFAEETASGEDLALVRSLERTDRVFLGVGVQLTEDNPPQTEHASLSQPVNPFLQKFTYDIAIKGKPKVVSAGRIVAPLPALMATAAGIGHISFAPDEDGVARHLPLFLNMNGKYFPSIDIELARAILDVGQKDIEISPGRCVTFKGARIPGLSATEDIVIPIDSRMRVDINYAGRWSKSFHHYPLHAILAGLLSDDSKVREEAREMLAGKLVVLSIAFSGASDMGPTPMEPLVPLSEIHGHVVSSIVQQRFLRHVPAFISLAAAVCLSMALGLCCFRLRTLTFSAIAAALILFWIALGFGVFALRGWILDIAWPSVVMLSAYGGCAGYVHLKTERERSSLRRAFSRYVSPTVLSQIIQHPRQLKLGGERVNLTVLVLVLDAFERIVENAEPEEIIDLLSSVYEKACQPILELNGAIDIFTKDGLIAFFGAPLEQKDHPIAALNAALGIRKMVQELAAERNRFGKRVIGIKMAFNTGFATVGNIGSTQRMNYAVIGKNVNLCVHLAHAAREGQILITQKTFEAIGNVVQVEECGEIRLEPYPKPYFVFNILARSDEQATAPPVAVQAPGIEKKKFLGPYTLLEKIGAGNMGTVYRGYDESLDRQVAIKVLFPHLSKDGMAAITREAKTLAKLSHPNVVQVYSAGQEDGIAFLAMEFVDGVTVRELINTEGCLPLQGALDILIQTARGLNAAHREGIIHRDIKPANLLLNNKNVVKITDFGLARLLSQDESTRTVAGTFQYISPEQAKGGTLDCRSDIYSLGISFFHLLVGEPPFKADTLAGLVWHHASSKLPVEPLQEKHAPEEVIRLLQKMTHKDPAERHQSYLDLLKELDQVEAVLEA